jgi:hypothetical protein
MKRRRRRGHFCWACQRYVPNERFSGSGHARHLCRQCSRLGADELRFRQAARDIDRLLTWDGLIRRKQRKSFERFLASPDARIRAYAETVRAHDASVREEIRQAWLADERAIEEQDAFWSDGSPVDYEAAEHAEPEE